MKISIVTPTYNRAEELEKLYTSLVVNNNSNVKFEWLIMDDGSTDKTRITIDNFIKQGIIKIDYHYQVNQGKMAALNNLMPFVTGEIVMCLDSDEYLLPGALDIIKKYEDKLMNDPKVYALIFLKKNEQGKLSGNRFPKNLHRSDMFNLYFREEITGEKELVFKTEIRKRFKHELEADEKFVTEARMYHKMDIDYDVICVNEPVAVCEYKDDGYTKNILKVFKQAPLGYYEYFKEILEMSLKGVSFKKKMYIYKHYILFATLAERDHAIRNVEGLFNKIMVCLLWIPGVIKTRQKFMKDDK